MKEAEEYTKKGIILIFIALLCQIISRGFSIFFQHAIQSNDYSFLIITNILAFISYIIFLIGLILMFVGRKEYGKKHSKFVRYAAVFYVVAFIIPIILSMIVSGFFSYNDEMTFFSIITGFISITASLFFGLFLLFLFIELVNKFGRMVIFSAFILSILSPTIKMILQIFKTGFTEGFILTSFLSIISSYLFLVAVYISYKRIVSGELTNCLAEKNQIIS
jgi:hypothetical protein